MLSSGNTITYEQEALLLNRDRVMHDVSRNLVNCFRAVRKITFETPAVGMTLKVTQGHRNLTGHISLPISGL